MKKSTIFFFILTVLGLGFAACHKKLALIEGSVETNLPKHLDKPYVVLISMDGFRWDYVERFNPPNLTAFIEKGVRAESMISCFPSKTFPNHYSIATGMFPENHGIVNNSFYDPDRDAVYRISDREKIEDGSWYGGTPLWVNAALDGMVSASFFFVGSEADIQGIRPTYYFPYDGSIANETRIEQILGWLKLPEDKRPHFITAYFSDMDDMGHQAGPNADSLINASLQTLDLVLGNLFIGLEQIGLPVNVILVSDHGMAAVPIGQLLPVESVENEALYSAVNNGAVVHLYLHEGADENAIFEDLKSRENHFRVYRVKEGLFYKDNPANPRLGDLIIIPDYGWYFKTLKQIAFANGLNQDAIGEHGFDPEIRDLHGIFYAGGPAFKQSMTIGSFQNIHVYPLICEILGLKVPKEVDGDGRLLEILIK